MVARAGFRPAAVLTFFLLCLSHLYAIEARRALPLPAERLRRDPGLLAYDEDVVFRYFEDVWGRYKYYAELYEKNVDDCRCLEDGTDTKYEMEQAFLDLQARVRARIFQADVVLGCSMLVFLRGADDPVREGDVRKSYGCGFLFRNIVLLDR